MQSVSGSDSQGCSMLVFGLSLIYPANEPMFYLMNSCFRVDTFSRHDVLLVCGCGKYSLAKKWHLTLEQVADTFAKKRTPHTRGVHVSVWGVNDYST